AAECRAHRHDRYRMIFDQPGGDALLAFHLFDGDGTRGQNERDQSGDGQRRGAKSESKRHDVGPGMSTPVTAISSWITALAAARTSSGVTAAILSGQFWISSSERPSDSAVPTMRAGPERLSRA